MSEQNDPAAPELSEAFGEYRPDLLRHCYRMLGSFEEAEDTVQDVLLRAWRSRDTYAGDAPLDRVVGEHSVRWIYMHMLEEYARHNGHADLLRERIDGATGA